MPQAKLLKRCVICGRIADTEHNAYPYKKNGVACSLCYNTTVLQAKKDLKCYYQQKYAQVK